MNFYGTTQTIRYSSVFFFKYFKVWFTLISDMFDRNGNFLCLEISNDMKVNTNFIEYGGLKKAIKTHR